MRLGYPLQWAFYAAGYRECTGEDLPSREIFIENSEPYDSIVYVVTDHVLSVGRMMMQHYMGTLAQCIAKDFWPGQGSIAERDLELPAWAASSDDDEQPTIGGQRA